MYTHTPFSRTQEFWDTDYTLWQTVRNREVSHWPATVSDPSFPSLAHPLRTYSECVCARGTYEKCVLNQCLSVVWNKTVNSSSSYKGEIIFFHAHLSLSRSLFSFAPSCLSCSLVTLWLIVLSCQAHSALNFLSQWHLSHSISIFNTLPSSTDQDKRASLLVTRPGNRNEQSC